VVFVVLVALVVSGVQHVDCVTFSTYLSLFLIKHVIRETERKRERAREKEKERERERERAREGGRGRGRGRERERERKGCFCKRLFFLLLAPGSALENFAAIVNPENKPTKVNWALSWPSDAQCLGNV